MLMLSWYINSSILYLLLLGKKGSVNLTKRLPYSVGGGIFFVGKEKVESTSSLQKREGKFTI